MIFPKLRLLLEGSRGKSRIHRILSSKRIPYAAKKELQGSFQAKLDDRMKRLGELPSERVLRSYAKLPLEKFKEVADRNGHLLWHGNNMEYHKPDHRKTGNRTIHMGTKNAAIDRAFRNYGTERKKIVSKHKKELSGLARQRYDVDPRHPDYDQLHSFYPNTLRIKLAPMLLRRPPTKVADFTKVGSWIKGNPNPHLAADKSDTLANRFLKYSQSTRNIKPVLRSKYNLNFLSPKERNAARPGRPHVVKYTNAGEDHGSVSWATRNPRLALTYRDLVRRYGNLNKSMKTGLPVKKPKV